MVSSEGACAAYYAYGRHLEANRKNGASLAPAIVSQYASPLVQFGET